MYCSGRHEPVNPILGALSAVVGAAAGIVVRYLGFLPSQHFFPHMLHTALPGMTPVWFLTLWIVALTVPSTAPNRRRRRSDVEPELHHVAFTHDVLLALAADLADRP